MSTTLNLLSYPETSSGVTLRTPAVAWAYSDWRPIAKIITSDIQMVSLRFQITNVLTADTTYEQLYEIGVKYGNAIVTQVQLPISARNDTAVGFYATPNLIFLPEPIPVYAGASLYVRVAWSNATALVVNGMKLQYQASTNIKPQTYGALFNNYQSIEVGSGMVTGGRVR